MGQPPVPIHYFPKRPPPQKLKADERPTEELRVPLGLTRGATLEIEPPIAAQPTTDPPDPKKGRKRKRKGAPEVAAEPDGGGAEAAEPLDLPGWLANGAPETRLQGLSRRQIAEICVFGHHLFETSRIQEAKVVFEGVVGLGVDDAFPHTMLGTIYLSQGEPRRALPLFEAAIKLDPRDVAAWVYRGEIRLQEGHLRQGLSDLRKACGLAAPADPFVARAKKLMTWATQKKSVRRR
jgi:tetratricopeptide (TPR) repeat protein